MIADIKIGRCKGKQTKIRLLELLEEELGEETTGLDEEHLPDKPWMMNILYTLDPQHDVF